MSDEEEDVEVVFVQGTPAGILYLVLGDERLAFTCMEALSSYAQKFVKMPHETAGIVFTEEDPDGYFAVMTPPAGEEVLN